VRNLWKIATALALAASAWGCGSASQSGDAAMEAMGLVRHDIAFQPLVGTEPWSCSGTYMMGTPPTEAKPSNLHMFVYDVSLVRSDGSATQLTLDKNEWQGNFDDIKHNVALLDFDDGTGNCRFADPETHTSVTGWAPKADDYTGISFRIGLPTELNHIDAGLAPPPMNRPGLWWAWKAGNILLRADFDTQNQDSHRARTKDDAFAPPGWQLWLAEAGYGDQACTGDVDTGYSCANQFQPKVVLSPFDTATDRAALDLGALLQGVDMNRTEFDVYPTAADPKITDATITGYPMPDYFVGCYTDRVDGECSVIFPHLGLDWMTLSPPDASKQDYVGRMP